MSGQSMAERSRALPFDSTQTIRAVTARELQDPQQQKWFAVQLAVSDRPVNLETMPRFDVFAAHRLYAIQGRLGVNPCYALRLGFFSERQSAETICTDLRAFYRSAAVVQVSEAEQVRFKRAPSQEAPAQVPVPTVADVVEITSARLSVTEAPKAAPTNNSTAKKAGTASPARKKFKSLSQELLEEARQIELAKRSGQVSKRPAASWLSRWFGR